MTEALLERLAAANPVATPTTPESELAALLATVLDDDAHVVTGRRPRRLRRGGTAALLVAAVAAGTAGATTHWFSAHTGRSSSTREPGDGGEILRNHGADIDAIIDADARDIPLPPGASFDEFKARTAADEPAQESATGLRASLEFTAACQWMGSWLDARAREDHAGMARAVRVLRDAGNWPASEASTSAGDTTTQATVGNAAARDDDSTVRRLHRANCAR